MTKKKKKILLWSAGSGLATLLVLLLISAWMLRPTYVRSHLSAALARHLNLDVTVGDVGVRFFPRPRVDVSDLTLRLPNRPDLPPFITIAHFWADVGLLSAIRQHVGTVHVDGLKIVVPPKEARQNLPDPRPTEGSLSVIVDHLIAHDGELTLQPGRKDRAPLTFLIHDLEIKQFGFYRASPFYAKLTNPVPTGLIETDGTFGPFQRDDPTSVPVSGNYTFTNADLSTLNGIGGTLSSVGKYEGQLTEISTTGDTTTLDFSLDLGGKPVPLKTMFKAVVDGTNGTTELVSVDARMLNTSIKTKGTIANLAGPGRHAINLVIRIDDGRIEDILVLAMDSPKPLLVGDLSLESTFSLPPGKGKVAERLAMAGRFGLGSARFTDKEFQEKLQELSRRGQGKDKDEAIGRVLTHLRGRFTVRGGVLTLPDVSFRVPGATVALTGTYGLESGALDFSGTLQMQATVSQAVGGFKSIFLKPFDRLFRKPGAGAVVPIRITGTRGSPKLGIQLGKVFKKDGRP